MRLNRIFKPDEPEADGEGSDSDIERTMVIPLESQPADQQPLL